MRVTLVALNNTEISTLFIIRVYPTQLLFFNYNVIDTNKLEIQLKVFEISILSSGNIMIIQ